MVGTDSRRVSLAPRYLGFPWTVSDFAHPAITVFGRFFQSVRLVLLLPLSGSLYPGGTSPPGLDCSAFARHYLRNHFILFSWGY